MVKISIIVPVYNEEKYLNKCLNSLINQTLKDIEIIVVNDGSTDNSLSVMKKFAKEYKDKIKIIDGKNEGVGAARNKGLDIATGEFVKFVDADDYLKLDILEKMYNAAKENDVKLVRGNYQTIIGPIRMMDTCSWSGLKGSQIVDVRKNKGYIITETSGIGNKLISRDLIGNLRFPEHAKWEDLALMPVVVASSGKLFHMDEPIYNYRVNFNATITDFLKKTPNILDIINSLNSLNQNMASRKLDEEYKEQIEGLYILHILFRVENAMMWTNFKRKNKISVINSFINILDLKYPNWKNNTIIEQYKRFNPLFNYNMNKLNNYINISNDKKDYNEIEINIKKQFQ